MLIQKLRKANADAIAEYRQLVANAASGVEVDPEHATQFAVSAGRSITQLASDIETATQRHDAMAARESRDFGSEISAAQKAIRESGAKLAELEDQYAAVHKQLRETRDRRNSASASINRLQKEDRESADALRKLMAETSGPGSDPFDPLNFRMS